MPGMGAYPYFDPGYLIQDTNRTLLCQFRPPICNKSNSIRRADEILPQNWGQAYK